MLHLEPLPEGGYLAPSDAIQGLVAQGRTVAETLEIARDLARRLLQSQQLRRSSILAKQREHVQPSALRTSSNVWCV
jgi:predicted RNase H-like HicB family nuclease